jgi:hypothetical protein
MASVTNWQLRGDTSGSRHRSTPVPRPLPRRVQPCRGAGNPRRGAVSNFIVPLTLALVTWGYEEQDWVFVVGSNVDSGSGLEASVALHCMRDTDCPVSTLHCVAAIRHCTAVSSAAATSTACRAKSVDQPASRQYVPSCANGGICPPNAPLCNQARQGRPASPWATLLTHRRAARPPWRQRFFLAGKPSSARRPPCRGSFGAPQPPRRRAVVVVEPAEHGTRRDGRSTRRLERQRHHSRHAVRCHRRTVAGRTTTPPRAASTFGSPASRSAIGPVGEVEDAATSVGAR